MAGETDHGNWSYLSDAAIEHQAVTENAKLLKPKSKIYHVSK